MYSKPCPTDGCGVPFTLANKPHKDMKAICPHCGAEVSLADAKPLPADPNPAATTAAKEVTK